MKNDTLKSYILLAISILIVIISLSSMNDAYTKELKMARNRTDLFIEYIVRDGDTLWKIACEKYPDVDPRKAVYIIREENEIEDVRGLRAGDSIWIPTEIKSVK